MRTGPPARSRPGAGWPRRPATRRCCAAAPARPSTSAPGRAPDRRARRARRPGAGHRHHALCSPAGPVPGALALQRDVFGYLPGTGRWATVLLADGNIGIGGDPVALLRRAQNLLRPGGAVVTEISPPGSGPARARPAADRGRPGAVVSLGLDQRRPDRRAGRGGRALVAAELGRCRPLVRHAGCLTLPYGRPRCRPLARPGWHRADHERMAQDRGRRRDRARAGGRDRDHRPAVPGAGGVPASRDLRPRLGRLRRRARGSCSASAPAGPCR